MNIYYQKKIHIDIKQFWKEIGHMSIVPVVVICCGLFAIQFITISNIGSLAIAILVLSLIYIPAFYLFSMNEFERSLVKDGVKKLIKA